MPLPRPDLPLVRPTAPGPTPDVALLQRLERTSAVFVVVATAAGFLLGGVGWGGGILGGGLLAGISYWAIRSTVDALVQAMGVGAPTSSASSGASARPGTTRVVLTLLGRHALLGIVAYVIIVRLRLHPVGVLTGASAVVVAAAREAIRGPS